jgi:hypothetical protein
MSDRFDEEARRLLASLGSNIAAGSDEHRLANALRAAERRGAERMRREAVRALRCEPRVCGVFVPLDHGQTLARFASHIDTLDIDARLAEET